MCLSMKIKCFFRSGKVRLFFNFPYMDLNIFCFECKDQFLLFIDKFGVIGVYSYDSLMDIISSIESDSQMEF